MGMHIKRIIYAFLFIGSSSAIVFGQPETKTIYLKDGTIIQGTVVARDDSTIVVETQYGTLEIGKVTILREELAKSSAPRSTRSDAETIYMKDGTRIRGVIVSEDKERLIVETSLGIMKVPKSAVERLGGETSSRRDSVMRVVTPEATVGNTMDAATRVPQYLPPLDESPFISEFGVGFGLPYGLLGGRISVGGSLLSGDAGLGVIPFAWDVSVSLGASLHLMPRYSAVRPKLTFLWSNTVGYNLSLGRSVYSGLISDYQVLYKEAFPGFAAYGGLDIRFGEGSNICLDLSVGWIFPSIGIDEQKKRWDLERESMGRRGWTLESETAPTAGPKLSIGLSYTLGRSMVLR